MYNKGGRFYERQKRFTVNKMLFFFNFECSVLFPRYLGMQIELQICEKKSEFNSSDSK